MTTLKILIEQRVAAKTRKVMPGDDAIPCEDAVAIAAEAATIAARQSVAKDSRHERFAAACNVACSLAHGRKMNADGARYLAHCALLIVDDLWSRTVEGGTD